MMDYRGYDAIYADSEEKFLKAVILYGKTSDNYVYSKEGMKEDDRIDKDTLMELLKKGVIVKYDTDFYAPISFADETTYTSLTIATAVNASSSASVTLNSKEYS